MAEQILLNYDRAPVRHSDPETSHLAANRMDATGTTNRNAKMCLEVVIKHPGWTAAEIAVECGLERHEPSRRLPGLRKVGLVLNWHWNSEWANVDDEQGTKIARKKFSRICKVTGSRSITWWPRKKEERDEVEPGRR